MPLNTNLLSSPYFDDFDRSKDYYRILFKPATAVQVREVNQLQSILQDQVEQFGDHILKSGTILEGCDFEFKNAFPYVKILDTTQSGAAVDLADINGLFVKENVTNKIARVEHVENGFENDPNGNLKTLYLDYNDDADVTQVVDAFTQGNILRVFAKDNRLFDLTVSSGGTVQAFSNSDVVVILPAIEVETVTDSDNNWPVPFVQGESLENSSGTIEVLLTNDSDFYSNTENLTSILRIKPNPTKQSGSGLDVKSWEDLAVGTILTSSSSNNELRIVKFLGQGATGKVVTTSAGQVSDLELTRGGFGYSVLPHVSVYSLGATPTQIQNLVISPQDFYQEVTIAGTADFIDPVGYGYGASVSSGKIYQKGLFLNVGPQFKMVTKYSNTPSDLSIGFNSVESVVNVFTDASLYDNAGGFLNSGAPGADRLKLTPTLVVKNQTEELASSDYFPLVRFAEGQPYSQNKQTQYNKIGDMIAQRAFEESGNYVLDEFNGTTQSTLDFTDSATNFKYVLDPGHAYIQGYRVKTETNFAKSVPKSTEFETVTGTGIDLDYANYIVVNEVGGGHIFTETQLVNLKDTAANFISENIGGDPALLGGTTIGTARIRNVIYESGIQGTADAKYRVYLYDINMNTGKRFDSVRALYSPNNGGTTIDGIADVVLENGNEFVLRSIKTVASADNYRAAVYTKNAEIIGAARNAMIFNINAPIKSFSTYSYIYRQSTTSVSVATNGQLSVSADSGNVIFPYIASLSDVEENDLIIIPENDIVVSSADFTGISVTSKESVNLGFGVNAYEITVGASPVTTFAATYEVGDWIRDASNNAAQILSIGGQNKMTIRTYNSAFAVGTHSFTRFFPKDVPIPLDKRSNMSASVDSNQLNLTVDLGYNVNSGSSVTITYDQKVTDTKSNLTVNRGSLVRVTSAGTWPKCLGFSGIFRLRAVYNGTTKSATNITDEFYIDHNQNSNYYGLGYLYKDEKVENPTALATEILIEFDHISEATHGLKIIDSYSINDVTPLANLTSSMHTLEIPEMNGQNGKYYDLRECADFRIFASNTANLTTSDTDPNLTCNPSETVSFPTGVNFKFPKPQSDFTFDYDVYQSRRDEIAIKADGAFDITVGASETRKKDDIQKLVIYTCDVAPYPSIPENISSQLKEIINKRIINISAGSNRIGRYSNLMTRVDKQTSGYTMQEISALERRIAALEYNQNISALENSTRNRTIQSSVDSTLERYKFGFFVDNFENYNMSNITDPNYQASIYEYLLQPNKNELTLEFDVAKRSKKYVTGKSVRFPWTRRKLVSQDYATYAAVPVIPEIVITQFCNFVTNNNNKYIGSNATATSIYDSVWEEFTFVGYSKLPEDGLTRQIKIDFFNPDGGIAYEVIQSNTPPTNNSQETGTVVWAPTQVTTTIPSSEKQELYRRAYAVKNGENKVYNRVNPWLEDGLVGSFTVGGTAYSSRAGAGQIKFDYDHTKGKYITVRVHKSKPVFNMQVCYYAETQADDIYDQGSTSQNYEPPCPRGEFLYSKCEGTTKIAIVCDGNRGEMVGTRTPNSPDCGFTTDTGPSGGGPDTTPPDNTTVCPAAGTVTRPDGQCSGTTKRIWVYTGESIESLGGYGNASSPSNQFIGECQVEIKSTEVNSTDCGYVPTTVTPEIVFNNLLSNFVTPYCPGENTDNGGHTDCGGGGDTNVCVTTTTPEPEPEKVSISIFDTTARENSTAYLKVRLDRPMDRDLNINFKTTDGTATEANQDYIPRAGTLKIPKGSVEEQIYVRARQDLVSEGDETMHVDLLDVDYEYASFEVSRGTLTITNVTVPVVSISDSRANERSGSMSFTVTLSEESNIACSVDYATATATTRNPRWFDSATAGQDYTATSGTLTFAAGETEKIITVPILTDTVNEKNELFNVVLSNAADCHIAGGGGGTARGIIFNTAFVAPPPIITINDDVRDIKIIDTWTTIPSFPGNKAIVIGNPHTAGSGGSANDFISQNITVGAGVVAGEAYTATIPTTNIPTPNINLNNNIAAAGGFNVSSLINKGNGPAFKAR